MPPNMYSEKNGMIVVTGTTTYKAETTVVVPINSPEPGDWFVGAYLSPWDEQVQQEVRNYYLQIIFCTTES